MSAAIMGNPLDAIIAFRNACRRDMRAIVAAALALARDKRIPELSP